MRRRSKLKRSKPINRSSWKRTNDRRRRERAREAEKRDREVREDFARRRAFRTAVLRGADYQCERCGHRSDLQAHHFIPRSRGGSDHPSNGVCLCFYCHRAVHDHAIDDWREWIEDRKGRVA